MTEEVRDPCELLEEASPTPENTEDTGVSTPEEQPRDTEELQGAQEQGLFPVNEISRDFHAVNRECVLLEKHNYYPDPNSIGIQIDTRPGSGIRFPGDAKTIQNVGAAGLYASSMADQFRYAAGKVYGFNRGRLTYNVGTPENIYHYFHSIADGVPFHVTLFPTVAGTDGRGTNQFRTFKENALLVRLIPDVFNYYSQGGNLDNIMSRYLNGADQAQTRLIPDSQRTFKDNTFSAPVGFFREEVRSSNLTIQDEVMIKPVIYNAPGRREEALGGEDGESVALGPLSKKNIYRVYQAATEDSTLPYSADSDVFQIFPSTATQKIIEANRIVQDVSNQTTLFDEARSLLNVHVKISFSMHHDSPIAAKLKEYGFDTYMFDHLVHKYPENPKFYTQVVDQQLTSQEEIVSPARGQASTAVRMTVNELGLNDRVKREYRPNLIENITKDMRDLRPTWRDFSSGENQILTRHFPLGHDGTIDSVVSWIQKYAVAETAFKMATERNQDITPSFLSLFSGVKNHSEVIGYRIEKKETKTNQVLQNIYVFNDPEVVDFDFLDTQVIYLDNYTYKIYTINCVIGSEYSYGEPTYDVESGVEQSPESVRPVRVYPNVCLIEAPYFEKNLTVLDAPPLAPDVQYLPFDGIDHEVEFRFSPRSGRVLARPRTIREEDAPIVQKMIESQRPDAAGKIVYDSDSPIETYEMLVLDDPPVSYADFALARVHQTTWRDRTLLQSVIPNKDYYLVYRAYDAAGVSNPSEVYRLRVNSFGNGITHDYEVYDMQATAQNMQTHEMTMERTLSVVPALSQCAVNFSSILEQGQSSLTMDQYKTAPQIDSLSLGLKNPEESIWNKKFKIRLISKTTGRAIDLNVDFQQFRVIGNKYSQTTYQLISAASMTQGLAGLGNISGASLSAASAAGTQERIRRNRERSRAQASGQNMEEIGLRGVLQQFPGLGNNNNSGDGQY